MKRKRIPYRNQPKWWYPSPFLVLWLAMAAPLSGANYAIAAPAMTTKNFPASWLDLVVSGRVTNADNQPLVGVNVVIKGTTTGTTTNVDGTYTLSVPDQNAVLVFSFIGYTREEVAVGSRTTLDMQLLPDIETLSEVVVVGYGQQSRQSLTGAVNQVTAQSIESKPVTNVLQALQGEAPNLIIQQTNLSPGSGVNINIRGLGTLGDNTPLVVIDGIIGGDINLLNPTDIASVSILKDAGSAAIYGSRAANGVILITTKSGKVNQKPSVSYSGSYGVQVAYVPLKKVNAWDNAYYKNESLVNAGLPPIYTPEQIRQLKNQGNGDWERQSLLQNAPQQSQGLAISGGGANSTYLVSAGYQNQKSNLVGPDFGYSRYSLRLNQSTTVGKFKFTGILNYVKSRNKSHSNTDWVIFADADRVPLNYRFQDVEGRYLTNPVASQYNVKSVLEKGGYSLADNDQFFGNLRGELSLTKNLTLTGVFGGTLNANNLFFRRLQVENFPSGVYGNDRSVFDNNFKNQLLNTQLLAEYNRNFDHHGLKLLLGAANESYQSKGFQLQKTLTDPALGTPTTGTIVDAINSYNSNGTDLNGNPATQETSINSVFGRLSYSYRDRYFLEGNFRVDESSKFARGNRRGFFPSIAGSWLVSEESFMQPLGNTLGNLKLRASYGVLGNQNVNAYQYQTAYFNYNNAYGFNNAVVGGAGFRLGNPDLTWERAATFNAGLDAGFFNNQLNVSFDYFDKTTSDILYTRQDVPRLFGAGFPDYNVAQVRNRGWETTIMYTLKGQALTHSFSFNLADNKNTLLALTSGSQEQIVNADAFSFIRRVGEPITAYYGYKTNGFFQNEDEVNTYPKPVGSTVVPGDLKFKDLNNDGIIDDKDKTILGNPFPRFTFGFTYRLAVKGFDVYLFVQGVGKRDAFIRGEEVEPFHYNYGATMYENQTDYWTPANRDAQYPRLAAIGSASNTNNWRLGSDIYHFNAAYARLKNVQIGYTLPQPVTKKIGIEKFRVALIGQNLLTLTKLNFIDPETSEFNNNLNLSTSSNSARSYPLPVFYGMGLDITF